MYVHDAVDQARIEVDFDPEADFDTDATLTTWHDDESLVEALRYALYSWNDEREIDDRGSLHAAGLRHQR